MSICFGQLGQLKSGGKEGTSYRSIFGNQLNLELRRLDK